MNRLGQFFEDEEGHLSSTRLAFLAWALGMLFVWGSISIQNGKLAEIDNTEIYILVTLMAGKVLQKNIEVSAIVPGATKKPDPPAEKPATS